MSEELSILLWRHKELNLLVQDAKGAFQSHSLTLQSTFHHWRFIVAPSTQCPGRKGRHIQSCQSVLGSKGRCRQVEEYTMESVLCRGAAWGEGQFLAGGKSCATSIGLKDRMMQPKTWKEIKQILCWHQWPQQLWNQSFPSTLGSSPVITKISALFLTSSLTLVHTERSFSEDQRAAWDMTDSPNSIITYYKPVWRTASWLTAGQRESGD